MARTSFGIDGGTASGSDNDNFGKAIIYIGGVAGRV